MTIKCFLKYSTIGIGVQIGVLLLSRYINGLGDFFVSYVYWPGIWLAIESTGAKGEGSMIWPPVFGLVGGVIVYSLIVGIAICYLKHRQGTRAMPR